MSDEGFLDVGILKKLIRAGADTDEMARVMSRLDALDMKSLHSVIDEAYQCKRYRVLLMLLNMLVPTYPIRWRYLLACITQPTDLVVPLIARCAETLPIDMLVNFIAYGPSAAPARIVSAPQRRLPMDILIAMVPHMTLEATNLTTTIRPYWLVREAMDSPHNYSWDDVFRLMMTLQRNGFDIEAANRFSIFAGTESKYRNMNRFLWLRGTVIKWPCVYVQNRLSIADGTAVLLTHLLMRYRRFPKDVLRYYLVPELFRAVRRK